MTGKRLMGTTLAAALSTGCAVLAAADTLPEAADVGALVQTSVVHGEQRAASESPAADTRSVGAQLERATVAEANKAAPAIPYDNLIGKRVYNLNGEELGPVENVVLDRRTDKPAVVISVGGVFGVGAQKVAIDYDDLAIASDRIVFEAELTEEQLAEAAVYHPTLYKEVPEHMRE